MSSTNVSAEIIGEIDVSVMSGIAATHISANDNSIYQLLPAVPVLTKNREISVFSQINGNPSNIVFQANLSISYPEMEEQLVVDEMAVYEAHVYFIFAKQHLWFSGTTISYFILRYSLDSQLLDSDFNITMPVGSLQPFDLDIVNDMIYVLRGSFNNETRRVDIFDLKTQNMDVSSIFHGNESDHGQLRELATDGSNVWIYASKIGSITKPEEIINPKIFILDLEQNSMNLFYEMDYTNYLGYKFGAGVVQEVYYFEDRIYMITHHGVVSAFPTTGIETSESFESNSFSNTSQSGSIQLDSKFVLSIIVPIFVLTRKYQVRRIES